MKRYIMYHLSKKCVNLDLTFGEDTLDENKQFAQEESTSRTKLLITELIPYDKFPDGRIKYYFMTERGRVNLD